MYVRALVTTALHCRRPAAGGAAGGGPAHHQQLAVRGHVREGGLQGAHPTYLHLRRLQGGRQGQLRGRYHHHLSIDIYNNRQLLHRLSF